MVLFILFLSFCDLTAGQTYLEERSIYELIVRQNHDEALAALTAREKVPTSYLITHIVRSGNMPLIQKTIELCPGSLSTIYKGALNRSAKLMHVIRYVCQLRLQVLLLERGLKESATQRFREFLLSPVESFPGVGGDFVKGFVKQVCDEYGVSDAKKMYRVLRYNAFLHTAITESNVKKMYSFIVKGASGQCNIYGQLPIGRLRECALQATQKGDLEAASRYWQLREQVGLLLKFRDSFVDMIRNLPMEADRVRARALISGLLKKVPSLASVCDEKGNTPLHMALYIDDFELALLVLSCNPKLIVKRSGMDDDFLGILLDMDVENKLRQLAKDFSLSHC